MKAYQPPRLHQLDPNLERRGIADQLRAGDTTGFTPLWRTDQLEWLKQHRTGRVIARVLDDSNVDAVLAGVQAGVKALGDEAIKIVTDNNPLAKTVIDAVGNAVVQSITDGKMEDERMERRLHGQSKATASLERDVAPLPYPLPSKEEDRSREIAGAVRQAVPLQETPINADLLRPTDTMHQAALRLQDAYTFAYDGDASVADELRRHVVKTAAEHQNARIDVDLSNNAGVVHVEEDGSITVTMRGRDPDAISKNDTANLIDVFQGREPRYRGEAQQLLERTMEMYGKIDTLNAYSLSAALTESLRRTNPALVNAIGHIHYLNPYFGPRDVFGKHKLTSGQVEISRILGDPWSGMSVSFGQSAGTIDPERVTSVQEFAHDEYSAHSFQQFYHTDKDGTVLDAKRGPSALEKALGKLASAIEAHRANPTHMSRLVGMMAMAQVRKLNKAHQVALQSMLAFDQALHGPRRMNPATVAFAEASKRLREGRTGSNDLRAAMGEDFESMVRALQQLNAHVTDPAKATEAARAKAAEQYENTRFATESAEGGGGPPSYEEATTGARPKGESADARRRAAKGLVRASEGGGGVLPSGAPADRTVPAKIDLNQTLTWKQGAVKGAAGMGAGFAASVVLGNTDQNVNAILAEEGALQAVVEGGVQALMLSGGVRGLASSAGRVGAAMAVGSEFPPAIAATFAGYYTYELIDDIYDGPYKAEIAGMYAGLAAGTTAALTTSAISVAVAAGTAALHGAEIGAAALSVLGPQAWVVGAALGLVIGGGVSLAIDVVQHFGKDEKTVTDVGRALAEAEVAALHYHGKGDTDQERNADQKHHENQIVKTMLEQALIAHSEDPHLDGAHEGKRGVEQQLERDTHNVGTHGVKHTTRGINTSTAGVQVQKHRQHGSRKSFAGIP